MKKLEHPWGNVKMVVTRKLVVPQKVNLRISI